MIEAQLPAAESERLASLRRLNLSGTAPEERFDRITRIAKQLFDVPIVAISLIDEQRQWFKSCVGLDVSETPRTVSFCAHAILSEEAMVIPDARQDPRFADNPLVTDEPRIRFYAGQPLASPDGHFVGALALMDRRPRELSSADLLLLRELAEWVEHELANTVAPATTARRPEGRLRSGITNWPLKMQVLLGPTLLVLVLLQAIGFTASTFSRLQTSSRQVDRTYAVLNGGSELIKLAVDMETGVRGFALARQEEFLEPYLQAQDQFAAQLADLRELVRDHPEQQARLDRVAATNQDWQQQIAGEMIRRARAGEDVVALVQQGGGKRRTDAIRADMQAFLRAEEQLLRTRIANDQAAQSFARSVFLGQLGVALAAIVLAYLTARRVVTPVRQLAGAARRIARGDLSAQVPVYGANELAQTGVAFNTMAQALAAARRETTERTFQVRLQANAAERARSENRAVLDAAGEAMILVAPDRRFLQVNRRFTELFGIDSRSVLGRNFADLQPEVERVFDNPAVLRTLVAGSAANQDGQFTEIVAQRWPERRELQLFSTPVQSSDGHYLGRLYVFRDVTHEREVDRMKSEFVSMVSHELRTPLTSIKGYVDLLLDGEVGPIDTDQAEFLHIVKNNADRLVALINDLLDISRIEAGRVELDRASLDSVRLVDGVLHSLRPQFEAKQQSLVFDRPSNLPRVFGDANRVTQILTNLLSNAHKYTPAGGRIEVMLEVMEQDVRISIQDSGIGLTPDEQSQIFTKFFRARNRMTQENSGTGLGLAITRSLVEMHGGQIDLISVPGAGSTFRFTLPIAEDQARPQLAQPAVKQGGTVLIVDDEPDIANLVRRYLERSGYQTLLAHTAGDAVLIAGAEQPDLITLDVLLPDGNGFTVLETLKGDARTANIPVLLLSIVPDSQHGKLLGAVDYLTKPVQERVLLDHVRSILSGSAGGPRTILLVDDDRDTRALLGGHLRRSGYQVVEAADGVVALRRARETRPDLVLMDVKMPGMDGVATLRALREDSETCNLPVVMMTASPSILEDNRLAIEALGGALLRKPVTAEELAAAITLRGVVREVAGELA